MVFSQIQSTHTLLNTYLCMCTSMYQLHSCQWATEGAVHMFSAGTATWATGHPIAYSGYSSEPPDIQTTVYLAHIPALNSREKVRQPC